MNNKLFRIIKNLALAVSIFVIFSCESDEIVKEITIVENITITNTGDLIEDKIKTTGYVVSSNTSTSSGNVEFVNYFEDKPTGDIDLTQFRSFERYNPRDIYKNFIIAQSTTPDDDSLSKLTFDIETGEVIEESIITTGNVTSVNVINNELAVYTVNNQTKLFVFNPTTLRFIRSIDMPNAKTIEGQVYSYLQIIYRSQDNKVFLPLFTNDTSTGAFYDANDVYVEVVDMDTFTWESTAVLENAQYPITRAGGPGNDAVDEDGNIYITCQGSYSLDFQAGPTAAIGSRPQIAKIPAGSTTFDTDYRFNPVNALGFQNLIAQFVTGTIYGANGIAYAAISAIEDDPRILELVFKLSTNTIIAEEFDELRDLVLNSATSRWARLDLNAQTAEVIADIPLTAGFNFPFAYESDGKFFFQVSNLDQGLNGYYEYDPITNSSFNLFNISAGGTATELLILSED